MLYCAMLCCAALIPLLPARFLDSLGYVISLKGFSGPYLDPEAIREDTVTVDNMNLYCVRKDLHQAVQAAPAAAGSTATAATAAIGGK